MRIGRRATRSGAHQFAASQDSSKIEIPESLPPKRHSAIRRSSYSQMTPRKLYVTTAQMARKLDCDKQTVMDRFRRGELEPQAFLVRPGGRIAPLYETGSVDGLTTIETQAE